MPELQLLYKTYDEAVEFAGKYGMNSILYNRTTNQMIMARLNRVMCYNSRNLGS